MLRDFTDELARLRQLPRHDDTRLRTLFQSGSPIYVARAPGRLDVIGGIADYSGSLVLELPIAEATFVAVQSVPTAAIRIVSTRTGENIPITTTISPQQWSQLRANNFETARKFFANDPQSSWTSYVAGPILALLKENRSAFSGGLRILVDSDLPEGKGVSSSAALEIATLRAVSSLCGIDMPGEELARMCQLAENCIVGAPCGIMDQMTSALGRANQLLALRCQPATIEGFLPIPDGLAFWGIDSGIRHAVSGSDYSSVRCGAFMGYRLIAEAAGLQAIPLSVVNNTVAIDDPHWNGYLANLSPQEFQTRFANAVPDQISGAEFLQCFGGITDTITRVDPSRTYAVRSPTLHPIEENARAQQFRALLEGSINEQSLHDMGRLMFASHASYAACGLASDGTDLLVDLVREAGPNCELFGAKITGGGSGGTVAILGRAEADEAVTAIARRYTNLTGRESCVFRGSSPGAYGTPVEEIVI